MADAKILVLGSNATRIELKGGGSAAIGQYLNETVVPSMALIEAGYEIVLATPDGTKPHIDEFSDSARHFGDDEAAYARGKSFFDEAPSMNQVRPLRSVLEDGLDGYAGVFVPGGHAPVVDLMQDADMGAILRHFHDTGKPTALLCHGPVAIAAAMTRAAEFRAALVNGETTRASDIARDWPYAGYRMTVFSTSEEKWAEDNLFHARLPFYMPDALRLAGATVTTGAVDWAPNVVIDRELITGQNMGSDRLIATKLIEALNAANANA
ncbi:type 1 glutamine amidotransferase domain-containing protein [Aureimonas jatrophae]|uniref:Putative intracellular protease/amidase n=1 Tax=Aureimonas jatrophae TaxID=1166073 RepID=A0A1H0KBX0_9HYPH|nr:type 1 glutamine amidotransferase domain-containing protein [Aureimonas jatrophae]MBB3951048.1 putative intracellular protease/amidase [Aureimonas jatrophae]SDO53333.1 Putative intracellular protease/amidase [Aureimonas jatrophae]